MEQNLRIGCVVLAAGNASRFGSNKLKACVNGQTLIRHALETVPTERLEKVVVVTQYQDIVEAAKEFRFTTIYNQNPEEGLSHSIHLGLDALSDYDGVLFLVSDQPLLQRTHVAQLVELWRQRPDCIAALSHDGVRGNPCLFPSRFFPELFALTGDRGGSSVIRRHEDSLRLLEVPARELTDADTPEVLKKIAAL